MASRPAAARVAPQASRVENQRARWISSSLAHAAGGVDDAAEESPAVGVGSRYGNFEPRLELLDVESSIVEGHDLERLHVLQLCRLLDFLFTTHEPRTRGRDASAATRPPVARVRLSGVRRG